MKNGKDWEQNGLAFCVCDVHKFRNEIKTKNRTKTQNMIKDYILVELSQMLTSHKTFVLFRKQQ